MDESPASRLKPNNKRDRCSSSQTSWLSQEDPGHVIELYYSSIANTESFIRNLIPRLSLEDYNIVWLIA